MYGNLGKVVNLGEQRFYMMIEENKFYIDKTSFIREWWEYGSFVTLITRPRRFGKTLTMSMVECFFSNKYENRADLFEGLSIFSNEADSEKYRALQGTFPVVSLSFAPVKSGGTEEIKVAIKQIIVDAYKKYGHIMDSDKFSDNERKYFASIDMYMDDAVAYMAINQLCSYLKRYYGSDVIVLLDEYDTPMLEAWLAGTWDETVAFFKNFFNYTFKTNDCLYRGLITGITRISKESIFSDLNNLEVVSITSNKYATSFGFTENEVFAALDAAGLGAEKENVKRWYDGFTFGSHSDIYNPLSIAAFLNSKGKYRPYWVNTSGNGLVNSLIQTGSPDLKKIMEELIQGGSFEAKIDEHIVFSQMDGNAVWSLLLAAGYLRVLGTKGSDDDGEDDVFYTLALTNFEVRRMIRNMVSDWFSGDTQAVYNEFVNALLNDNVRKMNKFMNKVALNTFSSFDSGNKPSEQTEPERLKSLEQSCYVNHSSKKRSFLPNGRADARSFYHGFVLGMVVNLADRYKISSNRESGKNEPSSFGRYDVMIKPLDKAEKAFIFEFKVLDADDDEETLADTVANALAQIEEKKYEAELVEEGFAPERIRKYGFAFKGKECLIG